MKRHLVRITSAIGRFLLRRLAATWPAAKGNWKRGMKLEFWPVYPVISGLLFVLLVPMAFDQSWQTGIGFLMAGISAMYFGYIFRNPGAIVLVFVGVIFGGTVTHELGMALSTGLARDWLPAAVLMGFVAYLWVWAERMKRVDFSWDPPWLQRFTRAGRRAKRRRRTGEARARNRGAHISPRLRANGPRAERSGVFRSEQSEST